MARSAMRRHSAGSMSAGTAMRRHSAGAGSAGTVTAMRRHRGSVSHRRFREFTFSGFALRHFIFCGNFFNDFFCGFFCDFFKNLFVFF